MVVLGQAVESDHRTVFRRLRRGCSARLLQERTFEKSKHGEYVNNGRPRVCFSDYNLMPGFHHSVAVSPFCRCKIPLFCKNYVRKFCSVTHRDTQRQRQWQQCTETAMANGNGNGETATEERQRNGGNRALELQSL